MEFDPLTSLGATWIRRAVELAMFSGDRADCYLTVSMVMFYGLTTILAWDVGYILKYSERSSMTSRDVVTTIVVSGDRESCVRYDTGNRNGGEVNKTNEYNLITYTGRWIE